MRLVTRTRNVHSSAEALICFALEICTAKTCQLLLRCSSFPSGEAQRVLRGACCQLPVRVVTERSIQSRGARNILCVSSVQCDRSSFEPATFCFLFEVGQQSDGGCLHWIDVAAVLQARALLEGPHLLHVQGLFERPAYCPSSLLFYYECQPTV